MNQVIRYLCILMFTLEISSDASDGSKHPEWNYPEDSNWPETCQGSKQSPIAITKNNVQYIPHPSPALKLINYEKNIKTTCLNNGHSVSISINPEDGLYITEGGLQGKYILSQIHFHWTSEHIIDKKSPLEGHFVHIKSSTSTRDNGINEESDLQVLGVLYKISLENNTELNNIIESIQHVQTLGSKTNVEFIPRTLLPQDLSHYYRYEGSLTTPPCYEIVQWTILAGMVPLSSEQYKAVNNVEVKGGVKHNFREVKPLNKRVVKFYNTANTKAISITLYLIVTCSLLIRY